MTTSKTGWTALHEAAIQGDAAAVEALLAQGADAHAATAEMLSSLRSNQILLPKGATLYVRNDQLTRAGFAFDTGATPVHVAAAVGSSAAPIPISACGMATGR